MEETGIPTAKADQPVSEVPVSFSPYTQRKTGISQSGAYVRVDDYYLISVVYKLSIREIFLLVSLNENEITFFRKYEGSHCSVFLSYYNAYRGTTTKILVPTSLLRVNQIPGRKNICVIQFSIKNCPEILSKLLTAFRDHMRALESSYVSLSGRLVLPASPDVSRRIGFNDYAEILITGSEIPVRILSFTVNSIVLLVSVVHQAVHGEKSFPLKLYFRQSRFKVNATVTDTASYGNIYLKLSLSIGFSPDLVEILSSFLENDRDLPAVVQESDPAYDYEELEAL